MSESPLSPPRTRSSLPADDINDFFSSVKEALDLHLKTVKWPVNTQPTLVETFPKERLAKSSDPFDVITYHVVKSEMAPLSNDGRVPKSPMLLDHSKAKEYFGYNTEASLWTELTTVQFDIWSRSNKSANLLAIWFHRFMMLYGWTLQFFRARGVEQFFFLARKEDGIEQDKDGQEIYVRSLVYQFRIQYILTMLEKLLDNVSINVRVDRQTDTIERP